MLDHQQVTDGTTLETFKIFSLAEFFFSEMHLAFSLELNNDVVDCYSLIIKFLLHEINLVVEFKIFKYSLYVT